MQLKIEVIAGFLGIACCTSGALAWMAHRLAQRRLARIHQLEMELAAGAHFAEQIAEYKTRLAEQESEYTQLLEQKMEAEIRLAQTEQSVKDWEQQKQQSVEFAKAAVLQAGQELSSKLLQDHKREQEEVRKQGDEKAKQLNEQFQKITQSVAALDAQHKVAGKQVEVMMRALTSPGGAGYMAEVGLENTLKSLGLEPERDFYLQYHIAQEEGQNVRPDAVVMLPQGTVMVIDCKASKFLLEWAEAKDSPREAEVMAQFVKTMRNHLRALAAKDYQSAVLQILKKQKRHDVQRVLNVMYIPSETAIERMFKADSEMRTKLQEAEIILVGPNSIAGLLSLARMHITTERQHENIEKIVQLTGGVMQQMLTVFKHMDAIGRGLKSTAEHYDKLAGSVNQRLLPRMRDVFKMGVASDKQHKMPDPLPRYEMVGRNEMIELAAEDEPEVKFLKEAV